MKSADMATAGNVSDAVVTRVEGDYVWVEVGGGGGCGSCKSQGGCGSGLLGLAAPSRQHRLLNTVGARPGDAVKVSVPEGGVLKAAALAYLLPLTLGIGGAAGGMWLGGSDGHALIGLAAGLAVGWFLSGRLARLQEPWPRMALQPVLRSQVTHMQSRFFEEP